MNSYNSIDTVISQAFVNMDYNKALRAYLECLQSILSKILIYVKNNTNLNENITNLINNETDIHTIIINAIHILKEQSITGTNITMDSKKITKKSIASLHDTQEVLQFIEQMKQWLYINSNFKCFLIKVIDLNINDLLNNRMCSITIRNWKKIYNNIINNCQYTSNNVYLINTIWYQQLRMIYFLYDLINDNNGFTDNDAKQEKLINDLKTKIEQKNSEIENMKMELQMLNQQKTQETNQLKMELQMLNQQKTQETNQLKIKFDEIKQTLTNTNKNLLIGIEDQKNIKMRQNTKHNEEMEQINDKLIKSNQSNKDLLAEIEAQKSITMQHENNYSTLQNNYQTLNNLFMSNSEKLSKITDIIENEGINDKEQSIEDRIYHLLQNKNNNNQKLLEQLQYLNNEKREIENSYENIRKLIEEDGGQKIDEKNLYAHIFQLLQNKKTQIWNLQELRNNVSSENEKLKNVLSENEKLKNVLSENEKLKNVLSENEKKISKINEEKNLQIEEHKKLMYNLKKHYSYQIKNRDKTIIDLQKQLNKEKEKNENLSITDTKNVLIRKLNDKIGKELTLFQKLIEKEEEKQQQDDDYMKVDVLPDLYERMLQILQRKDENINHLNKELNMQKEKDEYYRRTTEEVIKIFENDTEEFKVMIKEEIQNFPLYLTISQILHNRKMNNLSLLQIKDDNINELNKEVNLYKNQFNEIDKKISIMMEEMNMIRKLLIEEEKNDNGGIKIENSSSLYESILYILQNKKQNVQSLSKYNDKLHIQNRHLTEKIKLLTKENENTNNEKQKELHVYYNQLSEVKNKISLIISKSLLVFQKENKKEEEEEEEKQSVPWVINNIINKLNYYYDHQFPNNVEKLYKMFKDVDDKEKSLNVMIENINLIHDGV